MTTAHKEITLTQGIIKSAKLDTKMTLSTLTCTSSFDQHTAEAVGIKDSIYDDSGVRRKVLTGWKINQDRFGDVVTFMPHQKAIFGDKPLALASVRLHLDKVIEQDADGKLKMSFSVTVPGYPRDMLDFLEGVKRGECAVVIARPDKAGEDHAKTQAANFGLFALPKEPKPTKEASGNAAVVPPLKKKEEPIPATENELSSTDKPEDGMENGALASHATMGEKTRGRRRGQEVQ